MSYTIKGLGVFQAGIQEKLHVATELNCLKVEADSRKNAPVGEDGDAGQLRASITHEVKSDNKSASGYVGSNLFYAPYVHQGTGIYAIEGHGRQDVPWTYQTADGEFHQTSGMQPHQFITDAINENREHIQQHYKEVLGKNHDS